ncbi:DUF4190 domain-containing protein [Streptomyces sp. NPDC002580]|uniref:DUF4190 domain-containing protein n=1 Tax=Streptomyces sp. NPDC002580 TaxID=3364653 RepID=UPI00369BF229
MSDDARRPEVPHDEGAWIPPGQGNVWAAPGEGDPAPKPGESLAASSTPGAEPADAIPGVIPEAGAEARPAADRTLVDTSAPAQDSGPALASGSAPVAPRAASGADSAFDGGPTDSVPGRNTAPFAAAPDTRVSLGKGATGESEPNPWAPPEEMASPAGSARGGAWQNPTPPPVHGLPTMTSLPGAPVPPGPGIPGGPSPDNPFAPPGAHTPYPRPAPGEFVPPPPIAPGGPGPLSYGPGYGYPQYGAPHPGTAYPGGPGYGWPLTPAPSNGMGTAGLVLGIIAVVLFCAWPLAIVLGVLAVIFGLIGRAKARRGEATNPGQALAGVICGAVGVVLAVALIVFIAVVSNYDDDSDDPFGDDGFSTSLVTHRR